MNTISVTNPESNDVVTYTEAEVLRFILDRTHAQTQSQESTRKLIDIRSKVYDFFNEGYTAGETEITSLVEEVNMLLRDIGADELKRTWSATVRIYVNVSGIEAASKDEVEDMIRDDINVELQSIDGEIWVDDIEVSDIIAE